MVIAEYLPAQLGEADIKDLIAAAIAETGAAGPQQMGLVMKSIHQRLLGAQMRPSLIASKSSAIRRKLNEV